jgi:hypothetical protein
MPPRDIVVRTLCAVTPTLSRAVGHDLVSGRPVGRRPADPADEASRNARELMSNCYKKVILLPLILH